MVVFNWIQVILIMVVFIFKKVLRFFLITIVLSLWAPKVPLLHPVGKLSRIILNLSNMSLIMIMHVLNYKWPPSFWLLLWFRIRNILLLQSCSSKVRVVQKSKWFIIASWRLLIDLLDLLKSFILILFVLVLKPLLVGLLYLLMLLLHSFLYFALILIVVGVMVLWKKF